MLSSRDALQYVVVLVEDAVNTVVALRIKEDDGDGDDDDNDNDDCLLFPPVATVIVNEDRKNARDDGDEACDVAF